MKIHHSALNKLLPRLGRDVFGVILHGSNSAMMRKLTGEIIVGLPTFEHTLFHADDLGDNGQALYDICSPSLFNASPCVTIKISGDNHLMQIIADIMPNITFGVVIVVVDGSIKKTHALNKLGESHENIAIIPCYDATVAECMAQMRSGLSEYTIEPDAILFAQNVFANDLNAVDMVIKTIPLLIHPRKNITIHDLQNVPVEHDAMARDLAFSYLLRPSSYVADLSQYVKNHSKAQPTPYIMIIRAVMDILKTLHTLHHAKMAGSSIDQAINALKPSLFFKDKPQIIALMKKYDLPAVKRGLLHSLKLEKALKSKPTKVSCLMFEHG